MVNFVLVHNATADELREEKLKKIFSKPLIVGASVSADYHAPSPGKRLALQYTTPDKINVVAQNGRTSIDIVQRLTEKTLDDRSAIIGIDLILGEVPEVMPMFQKSAASINQNMRKLCEGYDKCKIVPLHRILNGAMTQGFVTHKLKKYTLQDLLPDGLHISAIGSEIIAEEIEKLF